MADRSGGADNDLLQKDVGGGFYAPAASLVDTTGAALGDGSGNLKVNVTAGGVTITPGMADNGVFAEGTTPFAPVGGIYDDAVGTAPTAGHAAAALITVGRLLKVAASAAPHLAVAQQTSTAASVAIAGAPVRPTRRRVIVVNHDATYLIAVGPTPATYAGSALIAPGASREFRSTVALTVIDDGTHHCLFDVQDEYD